MQQDGTVSYSLPDGMEEDFPVQAAQLTSAWDSFALESTAPQQRQQQQQATKCLQQGGPQWGAS